MISGHVVLIGIGFIAFLLGIILVLYDLKFKYEYLTNMSFKHGSTNNKLMNIEREKTKDFLNRIEHLSNHNTELLNASEEIVEVNKK